VGTAALDDGVPTEGAADRCTDRLATVAHEQPRLLWVQTPLDQVGEQGVADRLVLGAALPHTERLLATVSVHTQRDYHTVLGDQDPVDENGEQIDLAEVASEQYDQFLLSALDEAARETADLDVASGSTSPIGSRPAG